MTTPSTALKTPDPGSRTAIGTPVRFIPDGIALAVVLLLTGLWIGWLLSIFIYNPDYTIHNSFARQLARGDLATPHFLYHGAVLGVRALLPELSYRLAGWIVAVGFYLVSSGAVYFLLRPAFLPHSRLHTGALVGCTLLLMVVAPVSLLTTLDALAHPTGRYLFNYLELNTLHNPTQIVARPFPLLLLLYLRQAYPRPAAWRWGTLAAGALLTVVGLSAKPSYFIVLLPVLVLVSGWRWLRREPFDWQVTLFGIIIPALLMLLWQYWFTYTSTTGDESSRVILAPFEVSQIYEPKIALTLLRWGLSVLFPLTVFALYLPTARRDLWLNFAWLTVLVGTGYFYLLAESGKRFQDANFLWGAYLAAVGLFVLSLGFWWSQREQRRWKFWIGGGALVLHVVSGLLYLIHYTSLQPPPGGG